MSYIDVLNSLIKIEKTSNAELGKAIGVSDVSVSRWRKGEAVPSFENAIALANYFGVGLDELAGNNIYVEEHYCSKLPVLGSVNSIGVFLYPDLFGKYVEIIKDQFDGYPREECYALEITDISLEPTYKSGFYIIIHQQRQCLDGDDVVIRNDNGHYCFKKFIRENTNIILRDFDSKIKDIVFRRQEVNRIKIQGIVINSIVSETLG